MRLHNGGGEREKEGREIEGGSIENREKRGCDRSLMEATEE